MSRKTNASQRQLRRIGHLPPDRAQRAVRRLLVRCPRRPEVLFAAARLVEARQPGLALDWYRRAVYCNPRHADAWYRLGVLYEQGRQLAAAVLAFGSYLSLKPEPGSARIYLRLAAALRQLGQDRHALGFYLKALEIDQDQPLVFFALAQLLQRLGDQELALESLMTLGRLYPAKLDLVSLLMGYVLEKQGQTAAARQCYDEALQRQPRQLFWRLKRDLVCPLVPENSLEIEVADAGVDAALAQTIERLRRQPVQLPREDFFFLVMLHGNIAAMAYHHTPPLHRRRLLAEVIRRAMPRPPAWSEAPPRASRLRLGIVIAPRSLVLGYITAIAMAERLDPARFEVLVLCHSPEVSRLFQPGIAWRVRPHVGWRLVAEDAYQAVRDLRALQLDAIFYTEPGLDFHQYALALMRAAPVQFSSWMNPGSSGLETMDYFLSCELLEPPGAEAEYSESLERWPTLPACMPAVDFPPPRPRAEFGLEDDWHLYACLQNILKFHPDFDQLLAGILRRDPLGHLIMISPAENQAQASLLMKRFERSMPELMERIWVFPELPNQDFLQLLQCCDLALDPLHFSGGTTTYQSVGCGLPIVTWPGERMVARTTAAFCLRLGVPDGIVSSAGEYVERAVALAQDPARRADIARRMREALPRVYDDPQAVACFAEFLERAVNQAR
ncbi:MAG TPA: tetratricopeptide repeat protein [Candidatus Obscuribacterales bacterium]